MQNEIRVHSVRDREYSHLLDMIADLEARCRQQEGANMESERDYQGRIDQQERAVKYYDNYLVELHGQNRQRDEEGRQLYEDILGNKEETNQHDSEIFSLNRDLQG